MAFLFNLVYTCLGTADGNQLVAKCLFYNEIKVFLCMDAVKKKKKEEIKVEDKEN